MYTDCTIRPSPVAGALRVMDIASTRPTGRAQRLMTQLDAHVLERVLEGDNAAISRFVSTMTPVIQARVSRCLLKGTPRDIRRDVEDFSQDVYAHLFADGARILHRYDSDQGLSLRNYVGLVAERRVISQLRSSRNNPWRENISLENEPMPLCGRGSPEREASGQSSLDALLDLLRTTLSPLAWRLFQLLYVQELSVNEVCAETDLSTDAVYAWRSRLRKAARNAQTQLNPGADPP